MKVIDDVLKRVNDQPHSEASRLLALALASSCSDSYQVNLKKMSQVLDEDALDLIKRLADSTRHADYSRLDQQAVLRRLRAAGMI